MVYQRGVYKKEFFAETRDQAVSMAAAYFKVDAAKLEISEIPIAVEGMGNRRCFVVAIEGTADQQPAADSRPPRDRDRDRGDRCDRGDRGRGGRDRDRGRDGGGRGRDDRRRGGRDRPRGGGGDRKRPPRGDRPEGVDHEKLEAVARDAAERVKRTGQAETLEWMNSKERWVVHNYLRNVDGVTSVSEGEGAAKRLKIIPE